MENWGEAAHSSKDYYPNYNLFQSSIFYDTDNFRAASLNCDDESSAMEPPEEPGEAAGTPSPEKRVVSREELIGDPDLFRSRIEDLTPTNTEPVNPAGSQRWGYDWTKKSWVKSGARPVVFSKKDLRRQIKQKQKPNVLKQLEMAPRISSSKAESMMQKMGWQGGALGKAANGILDPITPDLLYCTSNFGLGHATESPGRAPPKKKSKKKDTEDANSGPGQRATNLKQTKKISKKDLMRTNTLLHILDFVRDDTEIELLFDPQLLHYERHLIHTLVQCVLNENDITNLATSAQYDLAHDINRHNRYVLGTLSVGEPPNRQLTLFKQAPENVYLVTPDDFLPKDETDKEINAETTTLEKENDSTAKNDLSKNGIATEKEVLDAKTMEVEDDENPFLKSIKKSIKIEEEPITNKFEKGCNIAKEGLDDSPEIKEPTPKDKMVEFFLEFVESEVFNELRFLGKFTAEQMAVINEFLDDISACVDDVDSFTGDSEIKKVFKDGAHIFELTEGCNGTVEIHKKPVEKL